MASRRGYSAFLIAASLLMLSGLSVLYLGIDGSDGINEGFTWERSGNDVTVTGHGTLEYDTAWDGLVTLTLKVEGGTASVKNNSFKNCGFLTAVTIDGSVGSIGDSAFLDCNILTTVTVNGSIDSIENYAFNDCDSLTSVTIDGSVGTIGNYAFNDCDSLTSVIVSGPMGTIGERAFEICDSLTTVTVSGPVGTIGERAFYSCDSLITVTIDGSVDSIGSSAFCFCKSLITVTIDGSVGAISDFAFSHCDRLSELTIAGPITSPISANAFESCSDLRTVNIACNDPQNITKWSSDNGHIAENADTVNHVHRYSASYDWADDGSVCTVHIACANTADHNHDENAAVTSTVKIPPTETEKGTTEYSVSGTYDGYAYSDTKDIQDIPATGGGSGGKDSNILIYVVIAVIAVLVIAGGAFLFIRSRR